MPTIDLFLQKIKLPDPDSHKGQNGKLLIIGGSDLFHAASKWSLDVASKFVDMVFYASVPENNQLIQQAKGQFWNGIVVGRDDVEEYIEEADVILIGPGMTRSSETEQLTNSLLQRFPHKKWVLDAGALQMVDPLLLNKNCIITPHQRELEQVLAKSTEHDLDAILNKHVTILLKGKVDTVQQKQPSGEVLEQAITGGNAGMTKGGTGDVLAGIVAALYCTNDSLTAAVVGSVINKKAGEALYQRVGPFFNASDLVDEVPKVLWQLIS